MLQRGGSGSLFSGVGKGPTGVIKSILDTSRTDGKVREEIFVDIVEKISCTFSSSGSIQNSQIDGAIQACSSALPDRSLSQDLHCCPTPTAVVRFESSGPTHEDASDHNTSKSPCETSGHGP